MEKRGIQSVTASIYSRSEEEEEESSFVPVVWCGLAVWVAVGPWLTGLKGLQECVRPRLCWRVQSSLGVIHVIVCPCICTGARKD